MLSAQLIIFRVIILIGVLWLYNMRPRMFSCFFLLGPDGLVWFLATNEIWPFMAFEFTTLVLFFPPFLIRFF